MLKGSFYFLTFVIGLSGLIFLNDMILLKCAVFGVGCEYNAKRIYPEQGMFMDMNKTYRLNCYIEWRGPKEAYKKEYYKLAFNSNESYVDFQEDIGFFSEHWVSSKPIEIYENIKGMLVFGVGESYVGSYTLNKVRGSFGVSVDDNGSCIEEGWGWFFNEEANTLTYEQDNK